MKTDHLWDGMTLGEELGFGSYGTVYRAHWNGKEYALKKIRIPEEAEEAGLSQLPKDDPDRKAWAKKRTEELLNEIRILQKFREDPHIVSVADDRVRETDTGYELLLLMEMLEPFSDYVATHRMDEAETIRLGLDLCSALETCEREKIVHRDLKPDNILVTKDGRFKLCDFGEAKDLEKSMSAHSVRGTFSYMAPEVYHGQRYDRRADIYALGLILYRLLNSGKEPFLDPSQRIVSPKERGDAMNRRMNGEALPAPAEASPGMAEILLKACAYYPEKRYDRAAALKADLLRLQKGSYRFKKKKTARYGKRTRADRVRTAAAALLILAAAVVLFFAGRYVYREKYVNYCDTVLQQEMEAAGLHNTARLNGNGVLYINSMEDLFCTEDGRYPWMTQKDRIRKIVFGPEMRGCPPGPERQQIIAYHGNNAPGFTVTDSQIGGYFAPDAFSNCRNLTEVTILSDTFSMDRCIFFRECDKLAKINCPADTEFILGINPDPLVDTAWYQAEGCRVLGTTLVRYNGDREVLDDLPSSVRLIATEAFYGQEKIKKVILPENVRVISSDAFEGCTALEEVTLPECLTTIETGVFDGCAALSRLDIPQNVTELGYGALRGCDSLRALTVHPDNAAFAVENGVLYSADGRELIWCSPAAAGTLRIPDSVETVRGQAFRDASALERLEIPAGLTLPTDLFGACPQLIDVGLPAEEPPFQREGALLYGADGACLLLCMRNAEGRVEVADGVQALMDYAFCSCTGVTEVILPQTLGNIMSGAFRGCGSLTELTIPASVTMIANHVFDGCDSMRDVYYQGSQEAWENMTARFELGLPEGVTVHFGD